MSQNEKLVFKPAVQALFVAGLADRMTPAFTVTLKAIGIDLARLLPGYPYELWERALEATAKELFAQLGRPEALLELGRRLALASVEANPTGKVLLPLMRVMGTSRAVKRALTHGTEVNYNVVTFGEEQPRSMLVHMSYVGSVPDVARGGIVGLGEALGTSLRATTIKHEAPRATYLVEW